MSRFPLWPVIVPTLGLATGYWAGHAQFSPAPLPAHADAIPETAAQPPESAAPADEARALLTPGASRELLQPQDRFGNARRLLRAVQGLTAGDFADADAALKLFGLFGDKSADATVVSLYQQELVKRWVELAPETARAAMPRLAEQVREPKGEPARQLLLALAKVRPMDVFEALPPRRNDPGELGDPLFWVEGAVFRTLAETDEGAARRLLDRCGSARERAEMEHSIQLGIAQHDPVAAARSAQKSKNYEVFSAAIQAAAKMSGPQTLEVLTLAYDQRRFNDYTTLVLTYPNVPWEHLHAPTDQGTGSVASEAFADARWMRPEQRQRLLERSKDFPASLRETIRWTCLDAWFSESPREAAAWSATHLAADPESPVALPFSTWLAADPAAARAWLESLPATPFKERLTQQAAPSDQWDGSAEQLRKKIADAGTNKLDSLRWYVAEKIKQAPLETLATLLELPAGAVAEKTVRTTVRTWGVDDPPATLEWAQALPPGPQREAALLASIEAAGWSLPQECAALFPEIQNHPDREEAARIIYSGWHTMDAAAARAWVESAPGVAPAWRQWMTRYQF